MPEIPPVIPGEFIFDTWGNPVARRTVQRYADLAQLGTLNPTPEDGDMAYVAERNILAQFTSGDWGGVFGAAFASEALPAFTFFNDRTSGMYRVGAGTLGFVGAGTTQFRTGNGSIPGLVAAAGSVTDPGYRFLDDGGSGLYLPAAGQVAIAVAGGEAYRATPTRTYLLPVVNDTTGNAATMRIGVGSADGRIQLSTSARKYKSDIAPLTDSIRDVVLDPATFHHDGGDTDHIGFIADDLADLDSRIGDYNEAGEIENYDLRAVVAILAAKVNDLTARLAALEG